ncbi:MULTISPECIES: alpha/beta fold hydrolase [unclassified Arsukibacterium]|uniref:alpha/beta fold hydrolase n=1 Tax=unclassified Arsukibacterium TaxID=2635278 RepID=UPI000C5DF08D|nr:MULTISPECIES: alpha/beta fold hydrolase [unclassified Arsukibacterium]MAA93564.1 alpha/beta hydrolase [Rheinheimera sp.]MBM33408.1 alpha/beta hydrolase [Rheinheimera sp.]|tara:strand:+ start:30613 stop:31389 length:777 start_codon:yes stop_codon:yes gene_type:complete
MILHSHSTGSGQPLILLHGLFGSYDNLAGIARTLSDQWHVISIDLPNHGQSPHSDTMDYSSMVADLAATLDNLNIARCAVLGHSLGGKLAMAFALAHPERVTELIIADIAPVSYARSHQAVFAGLKAVDTATVANRTEADQQLTKYITEPGVRQFLLKSLHKTEQGFAWRFNLSVLAQCYDQLLSFPEGNAAYSGPALFIKGAESDYILPEHRSQIMQYFPEAQAKIINGTGHWLHAEKPAVFTKLVKDFLLSQHTKI